MRARFLHLPARAFSKRLKRIAKFRAKIIRFVEGRPLTSFFLALLFLLGVIVLGNFLGKPKEVPEAEPQAKKVEVYTIGKAPTTKVQGQVEKEGVIQIVAQAPGIVQKVSVKEGQRVQKGTSLISLSSNYHGGSAASVSRQLAKRQYQNTLDNFDDQVDLINKQREVAKKTDENSDKLREIIDKSISETRSVVDLNDQLITSINTQIASLEAQIAGGDQTPQTAADLAAAKGQRGVLLGTNNQLNQALRNAEYQASGDKPPATLSDLQKDIALKQLNVQERALNLGKDVGLLQLRLAQVSEALMFPVSPSAGTIQKVHVHFGQTVAPGTPLVTVYRDSGSVSVIVKVGSKIASAVSTIEESTIHIGDKVFSTPPTFVSQEATDGQLYSVIFDIPEEYHKDLTDSGYVLVDLSVGYSDSNSTPYIPLDAVFQTQDSTFIYVVDFEKAASRNVELGEVVGNDVEVKSGLSNGDLVILNRNIIAGDKVSVGK